MRKTVKVKPSFLKSITEHGVLVPIVAQESTDGLEVIDGQMRTLAAVDAGLTEVPVFVRAVMATDADRSVEQLVVNSDREGLTKSDEVAAVKQLALDFKMPVAQIVKRLGIPKAAVEQVLVVAGSEVATKAIADHDITLDQAAALVEFEGNAKVLKDLLARAGSSSNFDYAVREARTKMKAAVQKKELLDKLKTAGVPKVNEGDYYSYGKGPGKRLDALVDAKDKTITPAAHKKCPGHAAFITSVYYGDAEIVYVCSDWEANGHSKKHNGPVETEEQRLEREDRERGLAEREQAIAISAELRGEFIIALLQRDVSKLDGVFRVVAEGIAGVAGYRTGQGYANQWRFLALSWLGVTVPDGGVSSSLLLAETLERADSKPLVVALACSLAMQEQLFTDYNMPEVDIDYLVALERWGHTFTELERLDLEGSRVQVTEEIAKAPEDEAGDVDDESDDGEDSGERDE